jgi:hypothetical protein
MFDRPSVRRGHRRGVSLMLFLALIALPSCGGDGSPTGSASPSSPVSRSSPPSPISTTPAPTPATWRRIASAPFRFDDDSPSMAVWDGREVLMVVTRTSAPNCDESVIAYDPASDSWRRVSRVPKPKGCFEGVEKGVWTGDELLLWGQANEAYDSATGTWRHLPAYGGDAGTPLVVWTGKQMIDWGGGCCDMQSNGGAAYTLASNSYKRLPPSPLAGRHAAGDWTGKEFIIAGGEGYAGSRPGSDDPIVTHFADAAGYNPAAHSWRKLPPMPVGRGGGYYTLDYAAVWDGTELLVIGGTRGVSMNAAILARGVAYDPSTNTWRWMAPMSFPRVGFVAEWAGNQLVVWGGTGGAGEIPPRGESYDPTTDTWSMLPKARSRRAPTRSRSGQGRS